MNLSNTFSPSGLNQLDISLHDVKNKTYKPHLVSFVTQKNACDQPVRIYMKFVTISNYN